MEMAKPIPLRFKPIPTLMTAVVVVEPAQQQVVEVAAEGAAALSQLFQLRALAEASSFFFSLHSFYPWDLKRELKKLSLKRILFQKALAIDNSVFCQTMSNDSLL